MTQKQSGFSLVELMITLAVLGIIAALAYPSFQSTIILNRVQSQTTGLVSSLMLARSEAIKTNQRAIICKSADQATCTTSGEWDQGWIIFRDANANDAKDADTTEPIIKVSGPIAFKVTIRAGDSYEDFLAFRPDGTTGFLLSNSDDQSFKICYDLETYQSRQVFIDASGRPRVDTTGVASCETN